MIDLSVQQIINCFAIDDRPEIFRYVQRNEGVAVVLSYLYVQRCGQGDTARTARTATLTSLSFLRKCQKDLFSKIFYTPEFAEYDGSILEVYALE